MANNKSSAFIDNLPKIYAMYTGGFLVFVLLMAILEQMGVSADTIGILFVAFTIVIYAAIGWLSRTMAVDAYYVAGRQVPAVFNGMATAADWMSGASFVAMAGGIYFGGHGYLAFVVGWTGGYILVAALLHGARLHRYPLRWQPAAFPRCRGPRGRVVYLCNRADQRNRNHRVACLADPV
jgi:hypothetical protein